MIFGIPGQTTQIWKNDLEAIAAIEPEHISTYSLTVEKQTPLYHLVDLNKIKMPHEKIDLEMFNYTIDFLTKKNYVQYEISNYSKPNKECRHNLHYWNRDPYISFGPSAHGFSKNIRYWNTRDLNKYMQNLNRGQLPDHESEILNKENVFNEFILNSIRLNTGININKIEREFNKKTQTKILNIAQDWGNHLIIKNNTIKLSKKGMAIADKITLDLASSFTKDS